MHAVSVAKLIITQVKLLNARSERPLRRVLRQPLSVGLPWVGLCHNRRMIVNERLFLRHVIDGRQTADVQVLGFGPTACLRF